MVGKKENFMKKFVFVAAMLMFTGCNLNYSINMMHTEGSATDMVDENENQTASPSVEVPKAI